MNGVTRMQSKKGNGYWLAEWNGQTKAFYDGCLGSESGARLAAIKWVNDQKYGKGKSDFRERAFEFQDWLLEELEKLGISQEKRDEIQNTLTIKLELYQ